MSTELTKINKRKYKMNLKYSDYGVYKPINDYALNCVKEEGWTGVETKDLLMHNNNIYSRRLLSFVEDVVERFEKIEGYTNLKKENFKLVGKRNVDFIKSKSEKLYTPQNYDLFCKKTGTKNKFKHLLKDYKNAN